MSVVGRLEVIDWGSRRRSLLEVAAWVSLLEGEKEAKIGNWSKALRFVFSTKTFDGLKRAFVWFFELGNRGF